MIGFLHWFKSSNKMKRWIFLILIGIILMCYGLAEILVMKELSFIELGKIIAAFVIGVVSIILGLVFLNKRTLEILIESTDERMQDKEGKNVKSLIFNKKVYHQGPNIVVIGGGTGLNTVLKGLKNYTDNLTAIVSVSDYGEPELKPSDDLKDSIIALANNEKEMDNLLNCKFDDDKLKNISFAELYFSAMEGINSEIPNAIAKTHEVLNITGQVMPVTLDEMNITAELANGYVVKEKSKIADVTYEKVTKINRIYLTPSNCRPAPGVLDAIKNADCIIIGPGSLYTNVIPNLLVVGVAKAIKESSALKVYISNIMTEPGQTDEFSVSDHINAIIEHCGKGLFDYCIYDTGEIVPELIKKYNMEGQDLVESNIDDVKGITFLQRDLSMIEKDCIRHDPKLVAESIIQLICDDLSFQDKQNDPQYLMLNNKLKEDKRINKIKKQMKKDAKKNKNGKADSKKKRGSSKFASKYSERIKSIKESDRKNKEKTKKKKTTSATIKKKTAQEIREEMIKKLENSNFKK